MNIIHLDDNASIQNCGVLLLIRKKKFYEPTPKYQQVPKNLRKISIKTINKARVMKNSNYQDRAGT